MHPILSRNVYLIKEKVGMFKAANNYDVLDPNSQEILMTCREDRLGFLTKMFRFSDYKTKTPFEIEIRTSAGDKVLTVKRGIAFWLSNVVVMDDHDRVVGRFKQQFFSIGGKFKVYDAQDNVMCTLKGKWTSWDFKFVKDGVQLAHVSKKWAGLAKEFFTSADNYVLQISDEVAPEDPIREMILAAVMCIDMVLKE